MIHTNSSFRRKNIFPSGLVCKSKPSKFDPFARKLCNRANVDDDDDGCVTKRAKKLLHFHRRDECRLGIFNSGKLFYVPRSFLQPSRGYWRFVRLPDSRGSDSAQWREFTQKSLHEQSRAINVGHDSARERRIFPRVCHVQSRKKFFNLGIQPKVR